MTVGSEAEANAPALRMLVVEDSDTDFALLTRELERQDMRVALERVQTPEALERALAEQRWDVVISDFTLPKLDGLEALALVRRHDPDLPFILVSGTVGEHVAVDALKRGANDYVMKGSMMRLAPAVRRSLAESEVQRQRRDATAGMVKERELLRGLMDSVPDFIYFKDIELHYLRVNAALIRHFQASGAGDPIGRGAADMLPREIALEIEREERQILRTGVPVVDKIERADTPDGRMQWRSKTAVPLRDPHGDIHALVVISRDVTQRVQTEEQIRRLAYNDELTGLANRNLFLERLGVALQFAGRNDAVVAVALIDVDGFKSVNDALGTEAGDDLLVKIGQRLLESAGGNRIAEPARVGADRFAIVLAGARTKAELVLRVEEGRKRCFGPPFAVASIDLRVSVKVGVAVYPDNGRDAATLFRNAEAAVKQAKGSGEPYVFFSPEMTQQVAVKLATVNNLRRALENNEFVLHYQPKVDIATGRIVGVEALIRWNDPVGERQVPPMEFIPLLEETGLIMEVGAWALREAARVRRRWVEAGLDAPRVAVNVSALQLRRRDFVQNVADASFIGGGLEGAGIDLEITESLIMDDFEGNIGKLKDLRDKGVGIAIDDFGTGYSSLAYLARLPVETVKIDRSFIIALDDENIRNLVTTIITLAHSFKLKVVAEGVDADSQLAALRAQGCDQMQGYLFSRPLPEEKMAELIRGSRV